MMRPLLALALLGLVACGTTEVQFLPLGDTDAAFDAPTADEPDARAAVRLDAAGEQDASSTSDAATPPADAGTDAVDPPDCGPAAPLPPVDGGGPLCTVIAAGRCATGQTCCHPSDAVEESCTASPASCAAPDGGAAFQCETADQCGPGRVCCANAAVAGVCSLEATAGRGTYCGIVCNAGELAVCARSADCPAGTTCAPFAMHGHSLGFCR